jgi:hypothetical protein
MSDFQMGEGDSLPEVRALLRDPGTGEPLDLTGCTATLLVANDEGGAADVMPVTIDPDQVANKGRVTFRFFNPGDSTPARYNTRVKVVDAGGDRISFDGDRMIVVEVTPDPGSTPVPP